MEYRQLGKTEMKVSVICLGTMTFGEQNSEAEAAQQLDFALERGVNFIDTAEMYAVPAREETSGLTESYIGNWLHKRGGRDKIVLATKVTGPANFSWLRGGKTRLTKKQIHEAMDGSLRRLQTDYVDLYQLHWPDRNTNFFGRAHYQHQENEEMTPPEESLEALAELVAAGKARAVGLSNETPWGLHRFLLLAETKGLPRIASVQNPYHLLNRSYETGMAEMSAREQCGLLAYSPLAFGALSGKYLHGQKPKGARLTLFPEFGRYNTAAAHDAVADYVQVAKKHGLDAAQMAIAFTARQPFVTSSIIGATSLEQLESNIAAADIKIDDDLRADLDEVFFRRPNPAL